MEERDGNHNVHWTKSEHGYFTGSISSGGGSSFEMGGFVRLPNGTVQLRLYSNGGSSGSSGGSSSGGFTPLAQDKVVNILRKQSDKWIESLDHEQIHSLKKYTKNSGDPKDNKFYQRINSMLRGDSPDDKGLRRHADIISSAIKKNKLEHDIICYRATNHDPTKGLKPGDTYKPKQFLSTSVTTGGA